MNFFILRLSILKTNELHSIKQSYLEKYIEIYSNY